jgi:hypothetical protein
MTAFVAMALLAGMSVDDALASLSPVAVARGGAEAKRQLGLLRSPDRTLRAHALAVNVAAIVRGLEALDIGATGARGAASSPPPLPPPRPSTAGRL